MFFVEILNSFTARPSDYLYNLGVSLTVGSNSIMKGDFDIKIS